VITKDNNRPGILTFNEGNDLEGKFAKNYRLSMKNKVTDEQSYGHYWLPLEPLLKNKKKIYFSPDGVYNQLNIYTLKKPGGDYLLNQLDVVLISNPRELVGNEHEGLAGNGKKATLLGFPDYGAGVIVQLPGTKVEVDAINKLLKTSGYQVSELVQREATETNLKSAHREAILHIATHGYFLKDVDKASWPIGVMADYAKDNVLLRSGLLLTGASEADKLAPGLDSTNNGIMTSYEAMNLDLKGTQLVVLSACETGLGEIKSGEGVYGLQRAFLVAGAQAVIMSLWKVDDEATQQLMNNFYSNWIKNNDRQKAFKQAQQQLMTKFKEPLYWGAFVMIED
jgi:CHAT domain-containing protein